MAAPLFPLGRVVATPRALALLADVALDPCELLERHRSGDWGNASSEDARENRRSIKQGRHILSSYLIRSSAERIWTITEADRYSTCVLLPEEY